MTEANFLAVLEILLETDGRPVRVRARTSGKIVTGGNMPLPTGDYDILCDGPPVKITNEQWVHRLFSRDSSGGDATFRNGIRNRDRKCVISGFQVPELHIQCSNWTCFQAAHIFPLSHEGIWTQGAFGRWIADVGDESSTINSIQNGMLLSSHVHQLFDMYLISVNPDDGYKIVVFGVDTYGLDGRTLDFVCRDPANPHRVPDQLLRWHYRQSVLANIRGAGELIFEHDFPPGTDMISEILAGPRGKERFELEMAVRLRGAS